MDDEVPLQDLHGPWGNLLRGGQVLTALILSTSYSEKYKGRHLQPHAVAEVRLPAERDAIRTCCPLLLHRSGNKEAVAFTWLGDERADDRTLYVAFSPLRYRTQFLKIYCAGMVQDGLEGSTSAQHMAVSKAPGNVEMIKVPLSAYIHQKLKKLWGAQGLWERLSHAVDESRPRRVIFAGISHGAALAQAAALQFQLRKREAQVYVVTWNAYRWTNLTGKAAVEEELCERILPFVLSRRSAEPQATRYWDSVTGFPRTYASMPHCVLLDADTGNMFHHTAPQKGSTMGALFLMRMFELHFAKAAIVATRKATVASFGGNRGTVFEDVYLVSPLAEALQDKVLHTTEHLAQAGRRIRRAASAEIAEVRCRVTSAKQDLRRSATALRLNVRMRQESRPRGRSWWGPLAWCCRG